MIAFLTVMQANTACVWGTNVNKNEFNFCYIFVIHPMCFDIFWTKDAKSLIQKM